LFGLKFLKSTEGKGFFKIFKKIHKDKKLPNAQIVSEWVKRCEQGEDPETVVKSYVPKKK